MGAVGRTAVAEVSSLPGLTTSCGEAQDSLQSNLKTGSLLAVVVRRIRSLPYRNHTCHCLDPHYPHTIRHTAPHQVASEIKRRFRYFLRNYPHGCGRDQAAQEARANHTGVGEDGEGIYMERIRAMAKGGRGGQGEGTWQERELGGRGRGGAGRGGGLGGEERGGGGREGPGERQGFRQVTCGGG